MFIPVDVVQSVCHYWLIDVSKTKGRLILFTFFQQSAFLYPGGMKRHTQILSHDILRYISKFRHSERNN